MQDYERQTLLKAAGFGGETESQRTAFDRSAKASSKSAGTEAPSFSSTMDEAISSMEDSARELTKRTKALEKKELQLEVKKILSSNKDVLALVNREDELSKQAKNFSPNLEGSATLNPLTQLSSSEGDLASILGAGTRTSRMLDLQGQGIRDITNDITANQKQAVESEKTRYDMLKGILGSKMDVGRYNMEEQLQSGKLEEQRWDIQTKKQKAEGTEPITSQQLIDAAGDPAKIAAIEYYNNRNSTSGIVPLIGLKPADSITNAFGSSTKWYSSHNGVDFKAKEPLPVGLPMATQVVSYGTEPSGGNYVTVKDADGFTYTFRHLSDISHVSQNMQIRAGDTIAISGNTGKMTDGAHVHMEMRNSQGKIVDPTKTTPPSMSELSKLLTSGGQKLTAGQEQRLNSVINKYNSSPLVLASDRVPVLEGAIKSVRKDPGNAAQQLNLVYSYVQALDTYQSAVREGELNLVNSIDSKIGTYAGDIQKIQRGQIVRPEVAKQIADAAETIVKTIRDAAKSKSKSFAAQANVLGVGKEWDSYVSQFTPSYDKGNNSEDLQEIEVIDGTTYVRQADGNYLPQ
jgi:hypothetical protein